MPHRSRLPPSPSSLKKAQALAGPSLALGHRGVLVAGDLRPLRGRAARVFFQWGEGKGRSLRSLVSDGEMASQVLSRRRKAEQASPAERQSETAEGSLGPASKLREHRILVG